MEETNGAVESLEIADRKAGICSHINEPSSSLKPFSGARAELQLDISKRAVLVGA